MDGLLVFEEDFVSNTFSQYLCCLIDSPEDDDKLTFAVKSNRLRWKLQTYAQVRLAALSLGRWVVADSNIRLREPP